ncbi:MAG: hypothetical protein ACO3A2_09260 [Bdellovibrionia bacterium]
MTSMNTEIKKVVKRVKEAQNQLQSLIQGHDWVEEARKYAERQGKEVKKLFAPDVMRMKTFLEKERKELERFHKRIPDEVKKLKKFVNAQKKEFETLLSSVTQMSKEGSGKKMRAKSGVKKATPKAKAKSKAKTKAGVSAGVVLKKKAAAMTESQARSNPSA